MQYAKLRERLTQPLFLQQNKLTTIADAILPTLLTGEKLYDESAGKIERTYSEFSYLPDYKVINIQGSLLGRRGFFNSGETVYEDIVKEVREGISENYTKFLFNIDLMAGRLLNVFLLAKN